MNGVVCLQHRDGGMAFLRDADLANGSAAESSSSFARDLALPIGAPGIVLSERERERASRFTIPRRRDEWLLGRMTARAAIAALLAEAGLEPPSPAGLEIIAGNDGEPRVMWLKGGLPAVAISLTHQGGWAAAWAAFEEPALARGIDLEAVEAREPGLVEQFFCEGERCWLAALPPERYHWGVNVVWSLKEAALKALKVGLRVDTRAIKVLSVEDDGHAELEIDPAVDRGLSVLSASWRWHHQQVLTRVILCDATRHRELPGLLVGSRSHRHPVSA